MSVCLSVCPDVYLTFQFKSVCMSDYSDVRVLRKYQKCGYKCDFRVFLKFWRWSVCLYVPMSYLSVSTCPDVQDSKKCSKTQKKNRKILNFFNKTDEILNFLLKKTLLLPQNVSSSHNFQKIPILSPEYSESRNLQKLISQGKNIFKKPKKPLKAPNKYI